MTEQDHKSAVAYACIFRSYSQWEADNTWVEEPRCTEAAVGLSEYSRHRVQSPLVVLTAWQNILCWLSDHTQKLSQTCDNQTIRESDHRSEFSRELEYFTHRTHTTKDRTLPLNITEVFKKYLVCCLMSPWCDFLGGGWYSQPDSMHVESPSADRGFDPVDPPRWALSPVRTLPVLASPVLTTLVSYPALNWLNLDWAKWQTVCDPAVLFGTDVHAGGISSSRGLSAVVTVLFCMWRLVLLQAEKQPFIFLPRRIK